MNRNDIVIAWDNMGLSCRMSITPEYARQFCTRTATPFKADLIYTHDKYRELSDGSPRVDCEQLLIYVCDYHNIKPNQERLKVAYKLFGEGSRRQTVEEAYLNEVKQ